MPTLGSKKFSRRAMVAGSGLAAAGALVGCRTEEDPGPGGGPGGSGSPTGELAMPDYIPFEGVTPEFPALDGGVPAGYIELPEPAPSVGKVPLPKIEPLTMMLQGVPPKVPFDQNSRYQRMVEEGGAEFSVKWAPFAEYRNQFQVMMASNDLPDLIQIDQVARLPQILESNFTELSEFLGGDKIADYPGLASYRPDVWDVPVVNGGLWGVARPRPSREGKVMLARGDLLKRHGINETPVLNDGEDFLALLEELTDRPNNYFALGSDPGVWLIDLLKEMYGAPNGWRIDGSGNWINEVETDEMKAAIETATAIWKEGWMHPNSVSESGNNYVWWSGDITTLYIDGVAGWGTHARGFPEWEVTGITVPKWDGGGAAIKRLAEGGYSYYTAIRKQSSPDRVREILRFIDYIAAPFGTAEWRSVNYGIEGEHVNYVDGAPVITDLSANEGFGIGYLGAQVSAQLFIPGNRDLVKAQQDYLATVLPTGEANAAKGLYSDTDSTKGATEDVRVRDTIREIIQGRKTMSDWDTTVSDWRSKVGDQAREEYATAAG